MANGFKFRPSRAPQFTAPRKTQATAQDVATLADQLEAAAHKLRSLSRHYDAADDTMRIGARAGVLLTGGALAATLKAFADRAAGVLEE